MAAPVLEPRRWSDYTRAAARATVEAWERASADGGAQTRWDLAVHIGSAFPTTGERTTGPEVSVLLAPGAALVMVDHPPGPGCPACLTSRHELATPHHRETLAAEEQWAALDPVVVDLAEPVDLARTVVDVARHLVRRVCPGPTRTMVHIDASDLGLTSHRYLPDPLCHRCGTTPEDDPQSAVITLAHRPKSRRDSYRYDAPPYRLAELKDLFVDDYCGILHSLQRDTQGGLAVAVALMKLRRHEWIEPGSGRSRDYEESEATAILEALERYGGVQPGGKRTVVHGSYAQLGRDAVDPRLFGYHPESTYAADDNPYRAFHPDDLHRWVWAYSFARERPVLVLESQAYYYVAHDPETAPFVHEISNGCALGSGLEEAILHGLLEVAERDAFLMTWYCRLGLPRLRPDTARSHPVAAQLRQIERETGYEIRLYDQTMENGIPAVWATARHPEPLVRDRPAQVCAAGAHPSLERAALNALSELGPFLNHFIDRFPDLVERAERMADRPELVRTMEDHSTLYGSPRMRRHLEFLDHGPTISFSESVRHPGQFTNPSMAEDVLDMVRRFVDQGQDVVVVDQTTDEHRAAGLSCVKVLVTGSLTMTFGHHLRRTEGIDRLRTVPGRLGLRSAPPTSLAVLPHPFP